MEKVVQSKIPSRDNRNDSAHDEKIDSNSNIENEHTNNRDRNRNNSQNTHRNKRNNSKSYNRVKHDQIQFYPFPKPSSRVVWKRKRYLWGVVGLHEEIEDFISFMEPTQVEQAMRDDVVRRIRDIITELWPGSKLETFGSYDTGLYLPDGDIDMVVFSENYEWDKPPLWHLRNKLIENRITREDTISVIENTVVPIIKFIDNQTLVQIDISFNTSNGKEAATLVKDYLSSYPQLRQMVFILKYILKYRGLNEVWGGGLGSYALTLLVVNFFQQHPREAAKNKGENLGTLLLEFFELYGRNFNYEQNGIQVRNEVGYVPIDKLREQMPHGNKRYGPLCIEDPLNQTNDVGRSTYHWNQVRNCFDHCCRKLKKALEDQPDPAMRGGTLLGQILQVNPELLLYRQWCNHHFASLLPRCSKNSVTSSDNDDSE